MQVKKDSSWWTSRRQPLDTAGPHVFRLLDEDFALNWKCCFFSWRFQLSSCSVSEIYSWEIFFCFAKSEQMFYLIQFYLS